MAWNERYVSVAGAGAHDGTSEADAWTLVESVTAVTGAQPGDRVNIIGGTDYTLGAALTFPNGANENPIQWRGYTSTRGDLESVGRATATAALTVANFPVIDGGASYAIILGQFGNFINIHFTSARNSSTVAPVVASNSWRCFFENTHADGGSAQAYGGGGYYDAIMDCDAVVASNSGWSNTINLGGRGQAYGCRIWNSGAANATHVGIVGSNLSGIVAHCLIFDCGIGVELIASNQVYRNTIYNVVTGVYLNDSNGSLIIAENIIYTASAYGIGGINAAAPILNNNAMGNLTSGRIDTGNLGSVFDEKNVVTLTGDPFTDAASEDFTLNDTAGAGALCRNASQLWGGDGDLGAVRHTDPAAGGLLTHPGMGGGMRG